jgi:hypothetical protein
VNEPQIVVNGIELSVGQAMTVRVALNSFLLDLQNTETEQDMHASYMTAAYIERIKEINRMIVK